jgi:dGTPase
LIDLADEIAYNTADLDDAFSAGLLAAEDVADCVPQYRAIHEAIEMQFPEATGRERFHEGLRHLIDALVTGLIEGTIARARGAAVADADEVRAFPRRLAAFTAEAEETSSALKQFLFAKVYASVALGQDRQQSMTMLGELFRFFLDHPDRLPPPYCQQALAEPAHRVVCDYIAGMTDAFFYRTYQQTIG